MIPDRDLNDEMNRHPFDETTAERLLSGRLAPEDAPPGLGDLAGLIAAATGPADASELARQATVVAAGVRALSASPAGAVPTRRSSMLSKLLTAKIAALAGVAAFGVGTAAAAVTGNLPGQTSNASSRATHGLSVASSNVAKHSGGGSPDSSSGSSSTGSQGGVSTNDSTSGIPATGPANQQALFGLCTAYLASGSTTTLQPSSTGQGTDSKGSAPTNPQYSSTAFKALIAETPSGTDTSAWCTKYVADHQSGSSAGDSQTSDQPDGKPSTAGGPSGHSPDQTGPPSTAGSSGSHSQVTTPDSGGTDTADTASAGASSTGTGNAGSVSDGASKAGSSNAGSHS